MSRFLIVVVLVASLATGAYVYTRAPEPEVLVLTGIVTTDAVRVSPLTGGRIAQLHVKEGDPVKRDQVIAVLTAEELEADRDYYTHAVESAASQIDESQAALRYQVSQTQNEIEQAEADLAAARAQHAVAIADSESARITFERVERLQDQELASMQALDEARTAAEAAQARVEAAMRQVESREANLARARANAEQIAVRRSQVESSQRLREAASAQVQKADVRLGYTEVRSPIDGIVDVRLAREGEVLTPGQPVVTLIDLDDLWIRVDIEETYIDGIRIGDGLDVRLPSGDPRRGTVFYRSLDAGFATQRDVSRTKRDIKTFEVRIRVDNSDRRLAVGMTASVLLPLPAGE